MTMERIARSPGLSGQHTTRRWREDFWPVLIPTPPDLRSSFLAIAARSYAEIFHGTLDEVWPKVLALNTPQQGVGVFVTIS